MSNIAPEALESIAVVIGGLQLRFMPAEINEATLETLPSVLLGGNAAENR